MPKARYRSSEEEVWQETEVGTRSSTRVLFDPFPKQQEFIDAVVSGKYRQMLYGGAIRGGKSYVLIALIFLFCRVFPGSRWAIVRKDMPTLRKNTLPVFEALRPTTFCRQFNQSTWTARCSNGSEVLFWPESYTRDPELNRWRGLEVNGFAFEEVNEVQEASWNKGIERAGSWKVRGGGPQPPPLLLASCNPTDGWVKDAFHDPWESGTLEAPRFYLPARITDNPHIDPAYLESLKDLPEPEYRRFVLGDWTVNLDPQQLIRWEWVQAAINGHKSDGEIIVRKKGPRGLGVDVARYGKDMTVFAITEGNCLYGLHAYDGLEINQTAQKALEVAIEQGISPDRSNIDSVGLGAGVLDMMHVLGFPAMEVVSGGKPLPEPGSFFVFWDRRAQIWWHARELFRLGLIRILIPDSPARKKLVADLTSVRYEVRSDRKLVVESKDDIKLRLGRSTDYGDAYVYALAKGTPRTRRAVLPPTIIMTTSG